MITDKMLYGKKKVRLNKAWSMFYDFCFKCKTKQFDEFTLSEFHNMLEIQFDNLVMQIKHAYEIED